MIVGGVNVSPAEVDALLRETLGVAEIGCCGVFDADLGEVVFAAIVLDGSCSERETLANLEVAARGMSGLKRPRHYLVVDQLPRNALGKLQCGKIALLRG